MKLTLWQRSVFFREWVGNIVATPFLLILICLIGLVIWKHRRDQQKEAARAAQERMDNFSSIATTPRSFIRDRVHG